MGRNVASPQDAPANALASWQQFNNEYQMPREWLELTLNGNSVAVQVQAVSSFDQGENIKKASRANPQGGTTIDQYTLDVYTLKSAIVFPPCTLADVEALMQKPAGIARRLFSVINRLSDVAGNPEEAARESFRERPAEGDGVGSSV